MILENDNDDISISISNNKIRFSNNSLTLTSKIVDGTFPDYKRVIPINNDKKLKVNASEFSKAVDRVSTVSSERSRAVKLKLSSGSLQLSVLEASWAAMSTPETLPLFGISLLLVGFGFKISAVPFHFVAPDAYAGASSPVAALLATASKTLGFIGLIRILMIVTLPAESGETAVWMLAFGILSIITMTWGNLAALGSENPKRMLAYSSVAHAGYMMAALVAVAAWKSGNFEDNGIKAAELIIGAVIFHLFVLISFKIGAFMVLSHLETENEVTDMSSLHGLAKREPIIATSMFVFMLALAGVPPLAGFMSKFLMVTGIVQVASADVLTNSNVDLIPTIIGMHWTFFLAIAIFINSAISLSLIHI